MKYETSDSIGLFAVIIILIQENVHDEYPKTKYLYTLNHYYSSSHMDQVQKIQCGWNNELFRNIESCTRPGNPRESL